MIRFIPQKGHCGCSEKNGLQYSKSWRQEDSQEAIAEEPVRGDGNLDQKVPQGEREESELLEKFGRYHHIGLGCQSGE